MTPYRIEGPAQISFSGGRSSAMMLCKIVEAHGGTLPGDVVVYFANTGKEQEPTYLFIQRVADHLGVRVRWVEYGRGEVDFDSASRKGEPFAAMITKKSYLPNPVTRICTQYLKVEEMRFDGATVSGIRADEPRRIAKMRARTDTEFLLPLADAGVTKADVAAFWKAMPFDLSLDDSNCDLCFLKSVPRIIASIRAKPQIADWWIGQEVRSGKTFRSDRPNYAALKIIAMQPQLFDAEESESLPCECTD